MTESESLPIFRRGIDTPEELPPRQKQILELILQGEKRRDIARELGISTRTVDNHLHSRTSPIGLYKRWKVHKLAELVKEAIERGYDKKI